MMGLEPTTFCMASRRSSQLSYIRALAQYSRRFRRRRSPSRRAEGGYEVDGGADGGRSGSADVSGTSGQFFTCDFNRDTGNDDCSLTGKLGKSSGTITVTV